MEWIPYSSTSLQYLCVSILLFSERRLYVTFLSKYPVLRDYAAVWPDYTATEGKYVYTSPPLKSLLESNIESLQINVYNFCSFGIPMIKRLSSSMPR